MANLGAETGGYNVAQQLNNGNPLGAIHGASTSDPIGFYGTAAIAQQASTVDAVLQMVNLGLLPSGSAVLSKPSVVNITANATTTALVNANRLNTVNKAGGLTVTLPAATGTGNVYEFFIGTTVTTGTTAILVASTSDTIAGSAFQISGATTASFNNAGATTGLRFNGSTTGGFIGDLVRLVDTSTGVWGCLIQGKVTSTAATPFY